MYDIRFAATSLKRGEMTKELQTCEHCGTSFAYCAQGEYYPNEECPPYRDAINKRKEAERHARCADLSAILAQFEALAGKFEARIATPAYKYEEADTVLRENANELSALIQSVKERM